jgi:DNA repair photolyase
LHLLVVPREVLGCIHVLGNRRLHIAVEVGEQEGSRRLVRPLPKARDLDLLAELAGCSAAALFISVTTLDPELRKIMEPRTSPSPARLATISALARAGVPAGVMVAPVIPGPTDHEMPAILTAATEAGASFAGYTTLRLPHAVALLFEDWLARHLPEKKDKILHRIRAMRRGRLNDAEFGLRMHGEGIFAEQISQIFHVACRKAGLPEDGPKLSIASFRRPEGRQMALRF